jgi:Reverse transcriptase (RNA-dependent DNA polymerase)
MLSLNKGLYEDLSSPTVSTSAVLTVLAVAAHENRRIAVVDLTGAYLNADMGTDVAVHMRLDPLISGLMMKLCNDYARFADERGCIVVRLQKALYGCIESAALWHDNLSGTIRELGYESGGGDTLSSFAPAPDGESDEPIHGMNPTPPDYAETMLPEHTSAEVGDTGEGGYPDPEVREVPVVAETVGIEQVATPLRRSMMDMLRRGGVETALSTSALDSIDQRKHRTS